MSKFLTTLCARAPNTLIHKRWHKHCLGIYTDTAKDIAKKMKRLPSMVMCTALCVMSASSLATPIKFRASLDGNQITTPSGSSATGFAEFELNEAMDALSYSVSLMGLDLVENPADRTDPQDVNKIHLHFGARGSNGPHVLNIFGLPSEDDDDLVVDYAAESFSGIWDDSDAIDPATGLPFDQTVGGTTKFLSSFLDQLAAGDIYLVVHTVQFPDLGEIRGQLSRVPTPATLWLLLGFVLAILGMGRRARA